MRGFLALTGIAFAIASILFSMGCVKCPELDPIEERAQPILEQVYIEMDRWVDGDSSSVHPAQTPIAVDVISDQQVRITYERDGQQVVEIYAVRDVRFSER